MVRKGAQKIRKSRKKNAKLLNEEDNSIGLQNGGIPEHYCFQEGLPDATASPNRKAEIF